MGHLQREQTGFRFLWSPRFIPPSRLAGNVRKYHLSIRFWGVVILRLRFHRQLPVRGRNYGHGDHLSLALWEGFSALL